MATLGKCSIIPKKHTPYRIYLSQCGHNITPTHTCFQCVFSISSFLVARVLNFLSIITKNIYRIQSLNYSKFIYGILQFYFKIVKYYIDSFLVMVSFMIRPIPNIFFLYKISGPQETPPNEVSMFPISSLVSLITLPAHKLYIF